MSQPIPPNAPKITRQKHLDPPKVKQDNIPPFSEVLMNNEEEGASPSLFAVDPSRHYQAHARAQSGIARIRRDPKLCNLDYKNLLSFPDGQRFCETRIKGLMNQSIRSKIMKLSSINMGILMSANGAMNMFLPDLLDKFSTNSPDYRLVKYLILTVCPLMMGLLQTMCSLKCKQTGTYPKDFMSMLSQELEFNNMRKELATYTSLQLINIITFVLENYKFLDGIMFSIFGTQLFALPLLILMRACFHKLFENYTETHKVQGLALEFISILNANKVKVE